MFRTVGGDEVERLLVQAPGEVNGVAGRLEWIVDGGNLTHQMFVRGGTIIGIPIRRGAWNPSGGGGDGYFFFRQGDDLLITKPDGQFVTMFPSPGGANAWFKNAEVFLQ